MANDSLTDEQQRFVDRTRNTLSRAEAQNDTFQTKRWKEKTGFPVGREKPVDQGQSG